MCVFQQVTTFVLRVTCISRVILGGGVVNGRLTLITLMRENCFLGGMNESGFMLALFSQ
jgi:hypothetical protein